MESDEMKKRTEAFALRVVELLKGVPQGAATDYIAEQLLLSGTSVGARYARFFLAETGAEKADVLAACRQAAQRAGYWLELMLEGTMLPAEPLQAALDEANQLANLFGGEMESTAC